MVNLTEQLAELGVILIELEQRGGYGLLPFNSLEGAPSITSKKLLSQTLKDLKSGEVNFDDIRSELEMDDDELNDIDE